MRVFVLFGGLLVTALLAALLVPYFVDWTEYRSKFEAEATRILGEKVTVAGDATARLIPFPSVTFTDIRVGDPDAPAVTAEAFSMDAELAPFLRGEVLIFDMRLASPVIHVELDKDGTPRWNPALGAVVNPANVKLENATFTDGTVVVRDGANGRQWAFTALSGTAAADSLEGPWRVEMTGLAQGTPVDAKISSGVFSRDGFALRIASLFARQNVELVLDGRIAPPEGEQTKWYSGTFNLMPPGSERLWRAEGVFDADARSFVASQFRADFGNADDPYTVNGLFDLTGGDEPRYALVVKGNQVNLKGEGEGDAKGSIDLRTRFDAIRAVVAALPLPPVPGSISLDLPAIVAGDTTIRDLMLEAAPVPGSQSGRQWSVSRFEAKLPGRTVVEAQGTLDLEGGQTGPSFAGGMVVASRQPSGLAAWLTDDVDEAIRRLPNAGFSGDVVLDAAAQTIDNLELILGPARLTGQVHRRSSPEALDSLDIKLSGNRPDFETLEALAALMVGGDGRVRVADHDIDLGLELTNPTIRDVAMERLSTNVRVRGGRTEIDRLSIDGLYGASVSATGTVVQGEGPTSVSWDASVVTPDGGAFVDGLVERFGTAGPLAAIARNARAKTGFGDVQLTSVGSAIMPDDGASEASASVSGTIGGTAVTLTATAAGAASGFVDPMVTVSGTLDNQEMSTLLLQAGVPVAPIRPLGAGQMRINASGRVGGEEGMGLRLALDGADNLLSFDGVSRSKNGALETSGRIDVRLPDAEPWWEALGYALPGTGLGTAFDMQAGVATDANRTQLTDMKGAIAETAFSGDLVWTSAKSLSGDLRLDALDASLPLGLVAGRIDAFSVSDEFQLPLYPDHALDLSLDVADVMAGPVSLSDVTGRLIYQNGELSVTGLEGRAQDGTVAGTIDLRNNAGTLLVSVQGRAAGQGLGAMVPQIAPGISGIVDASWTMTGTGRSVETLLGSLTGSGVVGLSDGYVNGMTPGALAGLMADADAIGYQITDAQIETLAREKIDTGTVALPELEYPFSVASGVARVSNVSIPLDGALLTADVSYDLSARTVSGDAALEFDMLGEDVAGTAPRVGYVMSSEETADGAQMASVVRDYDGLTGWIRQRALEREQARVEAMQARLVEKQRLRRETRLLRSRLREEFTVAEEARLRVLAADRRARAEAARVEAERIVAEEAARAQEAIRAAQEAKRLEDEARAAAQKAAEEKAAAEKAAAEKAAAEQAARDKAAEEKAAAEAAAAKAAQDAENARRAADQGRTLILPRGLQFNFQ